MRNHAYEEIRENIKESSLFRNTLSNAYTKFGIDNVLMDKILSVFVDNSNDEYLLTN